MTAAPTEAELMAGFRLDEYLQPAGWARWADEHRGPAIKHGTGKVYVHVYAPGRRPAARPQPAPRLTPPRPKPWQSDLRTLFPVTKYGRWPRDADGQRWMLLRRLNEYWQNGFHPRTPDTLLRWIKESR